MRSWEGQNEGDESKADLCSGDGDGASDSGLFLTSDAKRN